MTLPISVDWDRLAPPPPEWGHFAASRAQCPDCERWWLALNAANPFRAATLMGFFNHHQPDPSLAQGLLDQAVAVVAPDAETVSSWNAAAILHHIPAIMPDPVE